MIRVVSASHYFQRLDEVATLPSLESVLATVSSNSFRRIDRFIQLALLGSARCAAGRELQPECAIYLGSGLGPIGNNIVTQEQLIRDREIPKPFNFINTLGSGAGFYIAKNLGLSGQNFFISRRGASLSAVLGTAVADLETGVTNQALVGVVEEVTLPLAAHRKRQQLPADTPVAEGSHWLLLEAAADTTGRRIEMQRFGEFAPLIEYLHSQWRRGDSYFCEPEVDAEAVTDIQRRLPDPCPSEAGTAFHDSLSAVWLAGFMSRGEPRNLFLISGGAVPGWVLFHCRA